MKSIDLKSGTKLPLMNIKGKDYLQVAYRLVWFREEHKNWSIETEVTRSKDETFARASIKNEAGRVIATAHKFENAQGFADHAEKAETGAIGRALALCGYGTQFEPELDEGERLADSPVGEPPRNDTATNTTNYKVPFGQFKGQSLEQIPFNDLKSYVMFIEDSAAKENKPLTGAVLTFVNMATDYVGTIENSILKNAHLNYDPSFDQ